MHPSLINAEKIKSVAGLRPGRESIRLEVEHRGDGKCTIIHNVGYVELKFSPPLYVLLIHLQKYLVMEDVV